MNFVGMHLENRKPEEGNQFTGCSGIQVKGGKNGNWGCVHWNGRGGQEVFRRKNPQELVTDEY